MSSSLTTLPISYTCVENVYDTLPRLLDLSTLTSGHIAMFIGRAEAKINAMIVKRYTIPLTQETFILEQIANDMAIHDIVKKRLFTADKLSESPWPDAYKTAVEDLEKIADGKMPLVAVDGSIIGGRTDVSEVWSNNMDYHPTYSDLDEFDQIRDGDRLDDLRGDRSTG